MLFHLQARSRDFLHSCQTENRHTKYAYFPTTAPSFLHTFENTPMSLNHSLPTCSVVEWLLMIRNRFHPSRFRIRSIMEHARDRHGHSPLPRIYTHSSLLPSFLESRLQLSHAMWCASSEGKSVCRLTGQWLYCLGNRQHLSHVWTGMRQQSAEVPSRSAHMSASVCYWITKTQPLKP